MSFYLFGRPDEPMRLKSYSAVTKAGKTVLKIELESTDAWAVAHALTELAQVQAGQRSKPKSERAPKKATAKVLALPAPQLALPAPEGLK